MLATTTDAYTITNTDAIDNCSPANLCHWLGGLLILVVLLLLLNDVKTTKLANRNKSYDIYCPSVAKTKEIPNNLTLGTRIVDRGYE